MRLGADVVYGKPIASTGSTESDSEALMPVGLGLGCIMNPPTRQRTLEHSSLGWAGY